MVVDSNVPPGHRALPTGVQLPGSAAGAGLPGKGHRHRHQGGEELQLEQVEETGYYWQQSVDLPSDNMLFFQWDPCICEPISSQILSFIL